MFAGDKPSRPGAARKRAKRHFSQQSLIIELAPNTIKPAVSMIPLSRPPVLQRKRVFMQTVKCNGWWEQDYLGRQPMNELQLAFRDGKIHGFGNDIVGSFSLTGFVSADNVTLVKQYAAAHQVDYLGTFDGEGTFQGFWKINDFGGRWFIKIESLEDASHVFIDL